VPADEVAAERETIEAISKNEGKPEAALPKIVEGRLNGWFKERVLLDQNYARDEKVTVAKLLGGATVVRFAQVVIGLRHRSMRRSMPGRRGCVAKPRRIVLKMSGEALASSASDETIDFAVVDRMAGEIAEARSDLNLELAIMVGGGNIWRGTTGVGAGMDRATSDTMGMLGTVINALALQDALEHSGQPTRVLTAVAMPEAAEPYIRRRAIRHSRRTASWSLPRAWATLLHDRHLRRAPSGRDRGRAALQGHPRRRRRRVLGRPQGRPRRHALREITFMEVVNKDLR